MKIKDRIDKTLNEIICSKLLNGYVLNCLTCELWQEPFI